MTASRFPPVALPDSAFAVEVQRCCLDLPRAWEDYPWGDIVYKVGAKMFAAVGPKPPLAVTLKATHENAAVLTQFSHIRVAPYIGRHAWVSVVIEDEAALDQAGELILTSYELVKGGSRRRSRL